MAGVITPSSFKIFVFSGKVILGLITLKVLPKISIEQSIALLALPNELINPCASLDFISSLANDIKSLGSIPKLFILSSREFG